METATGDLLEQVTVGLGWLANAENAVEYDLDVWAFMLGGPQASLGDAGVVYYHHRKSADGSIVLSSDDRVGTGAADNETLLIDFAKVDTVVQEIIVVASIHDAHERAQDFYQVQDAYVHVTETKNGTKIARYDLNGDFGTDLAVELVRFSRQGIQWQCELVGRGVRLGIPELLDKYGVHVTLGKTTHRPAKSTKPAAPHVHSRRSSPPKVASAPNPPTFPPTSPVARRPSVQPTSLSVAGSSAAHVQPESRWKRLGTRCIGFLVLTAALWSLYAYLSTSQPISPTSPPQAATNAPPTPIATVSTVTLGSTLSGNGHIAEPTATFAPTDRIYAVIVTSLAATSVPVRLDWLYGNPRRTFKVEHATLHAGQSQLLASISNKEPWLPGNYSLDISVGGNVVRTAHFAVRKNERRNVIGAKTDEEARLKSFATPNVDAGTTPATSLSAPMPAAATPTAQNLAAQEPTTSPHPTIPPSFDCQLARTPTETAICSTDDLSRLDAAMGRLYHEVMGQATPSQAVSIRREQRQWLMDESAQCGATSTCIANQHQERIQALGRMLAKEKEDALQQAEADKRSVQAKQGQLAAADRCFAMANYDCSIQIAKAMLSANPSDRTAADLLHRSQDAQSKALHGNWNMH